MSKIFMRILDLNEKFLSDNTFFLIQYFSQFICIPPLSHFSTFSFFFTQPHSWILKFDPDCPITARRLRTLVSYIYIYYKYTCI